MRFIDFYKPIRKFSYPLTAVLLVGFLAYYLLWQQFNLMRLLVVLAATLFLLILWLKLRPGHSEIKSSDEVWQTVS